MKIVKSGKIGSRAVLEVEVDKSEFDAAYAMVLKEAARDLLIPGFRPGRAPSNVVQQNINPAYANDKALEQIVKDNYAEILKQSGLIPIDYPYWKILSLDGACVFLMEFDIAPEVALGAYKALEAKKTEKKVEDEQIENYIKALREDAAQIKEISDRAAAMGDIADLDVEGRHEGAVKEALSQKRLPILLGDYRISKGFDDNIEGMMPGQEKQFDIGLPEDHYIKEFAGKNITFSVRLNRLAQRELPEFDDEFAKKISSFESAQAYRQDIQKRFEDAAKAEVETALKDELLEKVAGSSDVDMPESLVRRETEIMLQEMEDGLSVRGLTLDAYVKNRKLTMAQLAEELRPSAAARAKAKLVLREIAKQESIVLSDDEMNNEIASLAKEAGKPFEEYRNNPNVTDYVEDFMLRRKALDLIIQNAKIK